MIVVCTGCSAKFKVADEKVGPRGAKLRCSRCQTIFMVRREDAVAEAPAPAVDAAQPEAGPPPFQAPPPLPRRSAAPHASPDLGAPVDARSAFEIDLEPGPARAAEFDPFAPAQPDDPFAAPAAGPPGQAPLAAPTDPFGVGAGAEPDPFAAVQAPVPAELLHARPGTAAASPGLADDPFATSLPPLAAVAPGGDLALEERTTPPPRPASPQSSAPLDDPFGAPGEPGELAFDGGHPGDIPPMSHDMPGEPFGGFSPAAPSPSSPPAHTPAPRREAPLHVDPFAAASVDADPLQVASGRAGAPASAAIGAATQAGLEDAAAEAAMEPAGVRALARLRGAAVNAVSLLALLVVAAMLLVVWRGDVPLSEAIHPSRLLAALTHRDHAPAPFQPRQVSSGLYERARGAPLLFVRGEVLSNAEAPVAAVRVAVELVKDGAVVGRGEAWAGGLLSPEELFDAIDAAALARAVEAAAARAPAPVRPGQAVPFLVALAEYPADLAGVALRVRAEGGAVR
jgi:predicted Zn finger-like uncharacterized protein